ncbi:hypothetical protein AVEN_240675-1 [Araneus ventricosus]|uniref:Uncharacterized protein n=1 Tax=Araneus ventricosus TaxID=182803 RepID=A0A4Y2D4F0_ARAVE|nr:hypothetical protein AVEN_240675-1 [Araneus ventricosus]
MYVGLKRKETDLANRGRALLQQAIDISHSPRMTKQKLEEIEGIDALPYPPYSLIWVRWMALFFRGRSFSNVNYEGQSKC